MKIIPTELREVVLLEPKIHEDARGLTYEHESLAGAVRFADLYELACWLARARLYVGNDSGIAHIAAAVNTPSVVIFGSSNRVSGKQIKAYRC